MVHVSMPQLPASEPPSPHLCSPEVGHEVQGFGLARTGLLLRDWSRLCRRRECRGGGIGERDGGDDVVGSTTCADANAARVAQPRRRQASPSPGVSNPSQGVEGGQT